VTGETKAGRARSGAIPADRLEQYERLIGTQAGVDRKGATIPYTSVNGNMFSYLDASGALALRLSASDRERFIAEHRTGLHEAYGHVQKEYVTVPDTLVATTDELAPWFAASYAYAKSLRPKPTTRRKARRPATNGLQRQ
jgi:hypothetical protein